jgi:hypothetical protein
MVDTSTGVMLGSITQVGVVITGAEKTPVLLLVVVVERKGVTVKERVVAAMLGVLVVVVGS